MSKHFLIHNTMKLKNTMLLCIAIAFSSWGISQNLVVNGDFSQYDVNCGDFNFAFTNFSNNCVDDWSVHSGSPSLGGVPSDPFAWLWSGGAGNHFEGIRTPVNFEQGKCYTVSFIVRTNDTGNQHISDYGTINLRAVNYQNGNIQGQQTIFSNTIGSYLGSNWHTVTTTFTPNTNYSMLLINPLYTGGAKQAEMAIDKIVIIDGQELDVDFHFEDNAGVAKNAFCEGEEILLDGSASQQEVTYFIDAWRRPVGGIGSFQYYSGLGWTPGQLGTVNLTNLFASKGIYFQAGYEYEIKVALANGCITWLPLTKRFTVKPTIALDSDFTMNTICAANGTITVQVTANNPNANQWWGLFETPTAVATGGTMVETIQGGTSVTYTGLNRTKNYYIKHGVWKDEDKNCYPWNETRKLIPTSVSWAGYTTNFALSVSSNFSGQASVNVLADTNPVHVYHGWEVYDVNHNVISGYCCSSDTASFSGLAINTWYYVKHGIWNDCKEWQETRKYFRVQITPSKNTIGGFILETKEYPFEPDSGYAAQKEELILSGAIFELYEEYKEGIPERKEATAAKLQLYPNPIPAGGTLTIANDQMDTIQKVELVTLSGKYTLLRFANQRGNIQVNLDTNVMKGMYFLRLTKASGEVNVEQLAIQ